LRFPGIGDGRTNVFDTRQRNGRLDFAGCRVEDVAATAAVARNMLAANEMTDLTHGCASSLILLDAQQSHFNLHKSMSSDKQPLCKN
jgi:hypothetical protein